MCYLISQPLVLPHTKPFSSCSWIIFSKCNYDHVFYLTLTMVSMAFKDKSKILSMFYRSSTIWPLLISPVSSFPHPFSLLMLWDPRWHHILLLQLRSVSLLVSKVPLWNRWEPADISLEHLTPFLSPPFCFSLLPPMYKFLSIP